MKKKIFTIITALIMATSTVGCGGGEKTKELSPNYISHLEDGVYYVRSMVTKDCRPLYFGNATFDEGSTTSSPSNERVMWYKDDFSNIPTLYEGDALILYTKKDFEEKMIFERFEDLGYTIGLCGLEELKSGRYAIYTDPEKKCTYPMGDTDEILKLTNKTVTLDTVGGIDIRVKTSEDEAFLTRCGTLKGLTKDAGYNTVIYDGTIKHTYNFKANVKVFGSMEVVETYDYKFEQEKLINITIPDYFQSGYYMINGVGLFRYVKGTFYDDTTNFNVENDNRNVKKIKNSSSTISQTGISANTDSTVSNNSSNTEPTRTAEETVSKFTVTKEGMITVIVQFTVPGNAVTDTSGNVTAVIVTPSGGNLMMTSDASKGIVTRTFNATEGEYQIIYYDLGEKTPHVSIKAN